jgi:hypothetical protein
MLYAICYTLPFLGHQTPHIYWWEFVFTFPLILIESFHAGDSIKVIVVILSGSVD